MGFACLAMETARRRPQSRKWKRCAIVSDPRQIHISWKPVKDADFYIIRYGVAHDRLFNNYQVYNTNRFDINSLNAGVGYYLSVDAVNDSGDTRGQKSFPGEIGERDLLLTGKPA